jgi:hypothetical protein
MAERKRTKGQTTMYKITQKDRAIRSLLKTGVNSERVNSSCSTCDTRRVTVKRHNNYHDYTTKQ